MWYNYVGQIVHHKALTWRQPSWCLQDQNQTRKMNQTPPPSRKKPRDVDQAYAAHTQETLRMFGNDNQALVDTIAFHYNATNARQHVSNETDGPMHRYRSSSSAE